MVKKNCDKYFDKHPVNLSFSLIGNNVIAIIIAMTIYSLRTSHSYDSSFYGSLITLGLAVIFYINSTCHLIAGNYMIFRIRILNSNIIFWNMLGKPLKIHNSQISSLKIGQYGYPFGVPNEFKKDKQGLTVFLEDGRFFRVSPHMSNINSLEKHLSNITKKNNHKKFFKKPNLTKLYFKPTVTLLLFYFFSLSILYSIYAIFNIYYLNHNDITTLFKLIPDWVLNIKNSIELKHINEMIYQSSIHIKNSFNNYPYLGLSLLASSSILVFGLAVLIRNIEKPLKYITNLLL